MTLFLNNGGPVKIRIGEPSNCYWATIGKGEVVDLSAEMGLSYGFSIKTTEGQIGNKKVETKQISVPQKSVQNDFFKELCSIRGIGKKTAEDITKIFPDREELIKKIRLNSNKNALPFREDACVALIKRYKYGS